jgi:hypothetical protein
MTAAAASLAALAASACNMSGAVFFMARNIRKNNFTSISIPLKRPAVIDVGAFFSALLSALLLILNLSGLAG